MLLHSVAGAISGKVSGKEALSGGIGAGINESLQPYLNQVQDPGLRILISGLAGGSAAGDEIQLDAP